MLLLDNTYTIKAMTSDNNNLYYIVYDSWEEDTYIKSMPKTGGQEKSIAPLNGNYIFITTPNN